MQLLLKSAKLTAVAGLRMARSLQLAGPARVEFVLPAGAEFARKALDSAENRAWVESEILRLTGKTVAVGIRLAPPDPPATQPPETATETAINPGTTPTQNNKAGTQASRTPPNSPAGKPQSAPAGSQRRETRREPDEPPQSNLIGEVDPRRDAYVCHVIETFNATVVRITHAPAARGTNSDPASP
ncbi:MAG: hypothetical protein ACK5YC_04065 [Planctomyces sp.]